MSESLFVGLNCTDCNKTYPARLDGTCECGGFLLARYDGWANLPLHGGLWSWSPLLPPCEPVSLGEVATPMIGLDDAFVKDEGRLPTGTFKARGAAVGVAMAKSLGIQGAVVPTAGNAGAAWASYCTAAGVPCAVVFIEDSPSSAVESARLAGAEVRTAGDIDEAAGIAKELAAERGWHLATTFKEPWRVEGKKTAMFEMCRDFGWRQPDAVVVPTGGGVAAIAFYLAARQLASTGWTSGMPRIYAVQAEGCAPLVDAFTNGLDVPEPWEDPKTDAVGIRIPNPSAGRLVLEVLRESGGGAVVASESQTQGAREWAARRTGVIFGLEAAAAIAGYQTLKSEDAFAPEEKVVIFGSASGRP